MRKPTSRVQVTAITADRVIDARRRPDRVVSEEPMEIRLHGPRESPRPVAVTMRTPGHDFELAVGFCAGEGLLGCADDISSVEYCVGADGTQEFNVITIARRRRVGDTLRARPFAATAACGVCGKATLDDLAMDCSAVQSDLRIPWSELRQLPQRLGAAQSLFATTGGLHAAALFDARGVVDLVREDVGRHNALDKVIGRCVLDDRTPLVDHGVVLSGRIGFELVQKAAVAGIPIVAAVGAPSSLAIDAARRFGISVVGFLRHDRANLYTAPERIDLER